MQKVMATALAMLYLAGVAMPLSPRRWGPLTT